ncbi:hypothetical protein [Bilophila wadsworthia]|uniref:hypothetical protein n=1 Tax=Bilophila wadsworthia TaxID=35833 RepID=UPI00266CCBB6|nr:hypothetical protein [Bilophila wadsworthia]
MGKAVQDLFCYENILEQEKNGFVQRLMRKKMPFLRGYAVPFKFGESLSLLQRYGIAVA